VSSLLGYYRIFNFAVLLGPIKAMLLWARALLDSVVAKQQLQTSPHALSSQNQKYFSDTNAWV
jgi:hypothetical protein